MWPTARQTNPARVAVSPLRWYSGRPSIGPPLSLRLLLAQQGAQALDVARHHRQGHIALETVEAMILNSSVNPIREPSEGQTS